MSRSHGLSGTLAYSSWKAMVYRCTSSKAPNWAYYGGRGITVCERWLDFTAFYADMGDRSPGQSIDRVDNGRGYEPGNCRWATRSEQQRNSRNAKLTQADVDWIRSNPDLPRDRVARALGISRPQVSMILSGRKWAA